MCTVSKNAPMLVKNACIVSNNVHCKQQCALQAKMCTVSTNVHCKQKCSHRSVEDYSVEDYKLHFFAVIQEFPFGSSLSSIAEISGQQMSLWLYAVVLMCIATN
jgi:hypothetical protein